MSQPRVNEHMKKTSHVKFGGYKGEENFKIYSNINIIYIKYKYMKAIWRKKNPSINSSIFHIAGLDTFWSALVYLYTYISYINI